jgi:hypothetical protein
MTTVASNARDVAISAIDLTRACAAHELYPAWLDLHRALGSAGVADYLLCAALSLQREFERSEPGAVDAFIAREGFADILMASEPLSSGELLTASRLAIREAIQEANLPPHPLAGREEQIA